MTDGIEQTRECPSCGCSLTGGEESCPQCGKVLMNSVTKPTKSKGRPSKTAKAECPYCGELISKRSKKCPSCRTVLKPASNKSSPQSVHEETSEPKTDLDAQVIMVAGDEPRQP